MNLSKPMTSKNLPPIPSTHVLYTGPKDGQRLPPNSALNDGDKAWCFVQEGAIADKRWEYIIPLNCMMPETKPIIKDILEEADELINGDRAASYGEANASFQRIADLWTPLLGKKITALDVARCMIAMKLSRSLTSKKRDNWVDVAGYASLASQIEACENAPE